MVFYKVYIVVFLFTLHVLCYALANRVALSLSLERLTQASRV